MDDAWHVRRTSFGDLAADYDATRPGWPAATAAWLTGTEPTGTEPTGTEPTGTELTGIEEGGPMSGRERKGGLDVLDLGAGTGKLTRTLADAGHRVTAADPSEGMIAVLAGSLPQVRAVVAAAERLPLPDDSFDAVTVAQAWHWVEPEEAAGECARVLRPGGLLGIGWHLRATGKEWMHELEVIAGRPDYAAERSMDIQMATEGLGEQFGPVEAVTFDYALALTPAQLARLASSWSYVAVRPDRDDVLARVEELGRRVAGDSAGLTLPYVTHCYRARLLP